MTSCEEYEPLIGTLIDNEITSDDRLALEAHLGGCANCRATEQAMRAQSTELRRAFAPHSRRAHAVAERVSRQLFDIADRGRFRWLRPSLFAGMAAGFLIGVFTLQFWQGRHDLAAAGRVESVGRFVFGTEPIELLRPGRPEWAKLNRGGEIPPGGSVRTGPKQVCEIQLPDGSQIRLNGLTEVQITDGRTVHLVRGELWGTPSRLDEPFHVYSAGQKITPSSPQLSVAHNAGSLSPDLEQGAINLVTGPTSAGPGVEMVEIVSGRLKGTARLQDVVSQTRWMHPILAAKGQDPELARRVEYLFEKLTTADASYDCEQEIRALGDACIDPLMNIVQSLDQNTGSAGRQRAARMLSELAGPTRIPALIKLLGDRSPEVRSFAERALVRITGRPRNGASSSVGPVATSCLDPRADWQAWWDENKRHYTLRISH